MFQILMDFNHSDVEVLYECEICLSTFKNAACFQNHRNSRHEKSKEFYYSLREYMLGNTTKESEIKSIKPSHQREPSIENSLDPGVKFSVEQKLPLQENKTVPKNYQCGICRKFFSTVDDLVTHIGTHPKPKALITNAPKKRDSYDLDFFRDRLSITQKTTFLFNGMEPKESFSLNVKYNEKACIATRQNDNGKAVTEAPNFTLTDLQGKVLPQIKKESSTKDNRIVTDDMKVNRRNLENRIPVIRLVRIVPLSEGAINEVKMVNFPSTQKSKASRRSQRSILYNARHIKTENSSTEMSNRCASSEKAAVKRSSEHRIKKTQNLQNLKLNERERIKTEPLEANHSNIHARGSHHSQPESSVYAETENLVTKTVQCSFCNRKYSRVFHLIAHVRKLHKKESNNTCFICGKTYSNKYNMERHLQVHIVEKTFPSSTCKFVFTEPYKVKQLKKTRAVLKDNKAESTKSYNEGVSKGSSLYNTTPISVLQKSTCIRRYIKKEPLEENTKHERSNKCISSKQVRSKRTCENSTVSSQNFQERKLKRKNHNKIEQQEKSKRGNIKVKCSKAETIKGKSCKSHKTEVKCCKSDTIMKGKCNTIRSKRSYLYNNDTISVPTEPTYAEKRFVKIELEGNIKTAKSKECNSRKQARNRTTRNEIARIYKSPEVKAKRNCHIRGGILKENSSNTHSSGSNQFETRFSISPKIEAIDLRTIQCSFCNQRYSRVCRLVAHVKRFHEENSNRICHICGKTFSSRSNKDRHLQVHTVKRNFHSPTGKKAFKNQKHKLPEKAFHKLTDSHVEKIKGACSKTKRKRSCLYDITGLEILGRQIKMELLEENSKNNNPKECVSSEQERSMLTSQNNEVKTDLLPELNFIGSDQVKTEQFEENFKNECVSSEQERCMLTSHNNEVKTELFQELHFIGTDQVKSEQFEETNSSDFCDAQSSGTRLSAYLKPGNENVRTIKCSFCNQRYSRAHRLVAHVRKFHEDKSNTVCHICGKTYSSSSNMERHLQVHIVRRNLNKSEYLKQHNNLLKAPRTMEAETIDRNCSETIDKRSILYSKSTITNLPQPIYVTERHSNIDRVEGSTNEFATSVKTRSKRTISNSTATLLNFQELKIKPRNVVKSEKLDLNYCKAAASDSNQCETRSSQFPTSRAANIRTIKCLFCNLRYSRVHRLIAHVRKFHSEKSNTLCYICGKTYSCKLNMERHVQTHKCF